MEPWSDNPINDSFKIKFFLDTNILSYLVDRTFSGLTNSIKFFVNCAFVELKSSRFVIFEFIKIRKKEHFLRIILEKSRSKKSGKVNLSSLLLYKDAYVYKGIDYATEGPAIKRKILSELERITNEFTVDFENNNLHQNIWKPTFDIHLGSKISCEDTLVLVSSTYPSVEKKDTDVYLLTNDNQFETAFNEVTFKRKINAAYRLNNLSKPQVIHIEKFSSNGTVVNLTKAQNDLRAKELIFSKVIETIILKNKQFFLGKTIAVPAQAPNNVICFELQPNTRLVENLYIVFVSKKLDFIYTTRIPINGYLNHMVPLNYPFTSPTAVGLAFSLTGEGGTALQPEILERLREPGNLMFIHPDT